MLLLLRELLRVVRLGAEAQKVQQHHPCLQVDGRLQTVEVDIQKTLDLQLYHALVDDVTCTST